MTATPIAIETETLPPPPETGRSASASWRWLPWLLLGSSLILFVYGERTIPAVRPSQWGLLAEASPAYLFSILLAAKGFAVAIRQANIRAATVATLLMIVVQRLPRAVATDMPMYSWTYKHLGVVDYIQHTHSLARDVDIYNGWAGLFALTAWFSDLTGVSPTSIAHWFIPVFHLGFALLVFGVARAWGLAPLTAVTATFLVVTFNWVEQDYYSPQATVMLFVAGVLALMGLSRDRPVGVWLILILFAAATMTHQLTPYWLLAAIGLLVVARKMKPWWIVIPLAAMLVLFLLYNWEQASVYGLFSGNIAENIQRPIPTAGVLGQRFTSGCIKALSVAMWAATALVLLIRWHRKEPFWALGVVALSPMLIVAVQSYGGEAVFRVFLYSLIGCSMVLSSVLVNTLQAGRRRYLAGLAALLIATGCSAQGNTGSWYANLMPKVQVDTSRIVLGQAELPAYLTAVAPVWPERSSWRYVDYARFDRGFDALMIQATFLSGRHFDNDEDYAEVIKALNSRAHASTYLIITDQMRLYSWYFGILPWDALPNLKERLKNDTKHWEPFYDGQGITVFVHKVDPELANGEPSPTVPEGNDGCHIGMSLSGCR